MTAPSVRPLQIQNRKYIGSKHALVPFIVEVMKAVAPAARTAADLFAGSGVVAYRLAELGLAVLANDHLYSNYIALRAFLTTHPGNADPERLSGLIADLNRLPPRAGYVWQNFGGTYFTRANAGRIDAARQCIADWRAGGRINGQEEAVLIAALLYAADKVANTCGQYDAFLKHLGETPYDATGRHRIDACVYRPLELGLPRPAPGGDRHTVLCTDSNGLTESVSADLVYLDPPYNTRQYVDNYHVLENIARWERPPLHGKTRKFRRDGLKSPYSSRVRAAAALAELVAGLRCRHLLLSYNNEGIIPDAVLLAILRHRGRVEVFTHPYQVFGNGAGRSRRRPTQERLFYCEVDN